jgi:hypothetical protein
MYNIFDREYAFAINVPIPALDRTTPYTDWLHENVGRENTWWAYGYIKVSAEMLIFRFYFRDETHLVMFKLAML